MKSIAVIPAGGKGLRSGYSTPKQFIKISGKEIIVYPLLTFQKSKLIDRIVIASEPEYFSLLLRLIRKYKLTKVKLIVEGGATRQQSVFNAVLSSDADADDLIVVHDAARALLPLTLLDKAVLTAKQKGNALVCLKAKDTLVKGRETVNEYVNRDEIFYVQTPQIFKFKDLHKALVMAEKDNFEATDESMLVKRLGKKIHIVEGSVFNFKVTSKEDIELFKSLKHNKT